MVKIGQKAPDFTAMSSSGQQVSLSQYRGKPVLLLFYCVAFSPVCTNELIELKNDYYKFAGVKILAVSADRYWVQKAFAKALNLTFPLVEDPDAAISKRYGVFSKKLGIANRAYFIIDEKGILRYQYMTRSPKEKLTRQKVLAEVKKVKR